MSFQETMKAVSDPVRRRILDLLKDRPLTAGEIGSQFDMTGATISHHLSILKKAHLVLDTKEGTFIRYELNATVLDEILVWVQDLRR